MAESHEYPALPILVIPHPFGGLPDAEIRQRAREVFARIPDAPAGGVPAGPDRVPKPVEVRPETLTLAAADEEHASRELERLGLTDGLPVLAPAVERVAGTYRPVRVGAAGACPARPSSRPADRQRAAGPTAAGPASASPSGCRGTGQCAATPRARAAPDRRAGPRAPA